MAKPVKYLLLGLLTLLYIAIIYGVYIYSFRLKVPNFFSSDRTVLTGKVLRGDTVKIRGESCYDQYYLVSNNHAVWLLGENFSQYENSIVEVTGSNRDKNNPCDTPDVIDCGCTFYIRPDQIKVLEDGKP